MQLRPRAARALSTSAAQPLQPFASLQAGVSVSAATTASTSSSGGSQSRIKTELLALADAKYALGAATFFKSDYSKGDVFIGVRVPQCRAVVRAHVQSATRADVIELLKDARHEVRVAGGICLVEAFTAPRKSALWLQGGDSDSVEDAVDATAAALQQQQRVVEFYLAHLSCFDNWDLVDLTSYKILGAWMVQRHFDAVRQFCEQLPAASAVQEDDTVDIVLEKAQLASAIRVLPQWYQRILSSNDFWETRVSIVLLLGIRKENVDFAIHICRWHLLRLHDGEYEQHIKGERFADYDLVHKATGWVLRECGKSDRAKLLHFLTHYAPLLPKTTLQYATEHFDRKLAKSLSSQGMSRSTKRQRVDSGAEGG